MWARTFAAVLIPQRSGKWIWRLSVAALAGWIAVISIPFGHADDPIAAIARSVSRFEQDLKFAIRGPLDDEVDPNVVVVGFDSSTESSLGKNWPPDRGLLANVVKNLSNDGAKVIVLDILLEGPTNELSDSLLNQSLRRAGNVVLAARIERDPDPRVTMKAMISPFFDDERGIDFEQAATLGLTEVAVDDDGVVRRLFPYFIMFEEKVPSLGLAAALRFEGITPDSLALVSGRLRFGNRWVPLTGQPSSDPVDGATIPSVDVNYPGGGSSINVVADMSEVAANEFPAGTFQDKCVFVGVTGSQLVKELGDSRINAATARRAELVGGAVRRDMPGVILQAHHFNAIQQGLWLHPVAPVWRFLVGMLLAWVCVGLADRILDWRGVAGLVGITAIANLAGYVGFVQAGAMIAILAPSLVALSAALATGWMDRARIQRRWASYVSPDVLKLIIQSDEAAAKVRCRATVLFADVRGFTALSDGMDPDRLIDLLNDHFDRLVPIVSKYGGTVDKFMGDGLLAVFGAPVPFADSAERAVRAAREMLEQTGAEVIDGKGQRRTIEMGIGLATGDVIAGHLGSRSRRDFTVIGDVVNLSSRLQGEADSSVVMDGVTAEECGQPVEPIGERNLKGFADPVPCFEVRSEARLGRKG